MFIYRIYNTITQENYIGQTKKSIDYRFQEHIREAKRSMRGDKRDFCYFHRLLLYYGVEAFQIELIEEVPDEQADIKEMYWIDYYDSYYNGYNSTKGGQNRPMSELALETNNKWQQKDSSDSSTNKKYGGMDIQEVISKGLYNPIGNTNAGKKVEQYSLNGELIDIYPAASKKRKKTGVSATGIRNVCNGKQKKSGGYIWKWSKS